MGARRQDFVSINVETQMEDINVCVLLDSHYILVVEGVYLSVCVTLCYQRGLGVDYPVP